MTTEIEKNELTITSDLSMGDLAEIANSDRYLPRIELFGSQKKMVKQKKFPEAHYGLVTGKEEVEDLGETFNCIPYQVRAKAMDFREKEKITTIFNKDDDKFKEIAAVANDKSFKGKSGCSYGAEFLIWLPDQECFTAFFLNTPTLRNAIKLLVQQLGKPTTLAIRFIPSEEYGGWHGPVVNKCSTPINYPNDETINKQLAKFRDYQSAAEDEEQGVVVDDETSDREV
jgi:hypothetical protein